MKIPKRKRTWTDAQLAQWTAAHPLGTRVRYWSVRGDDVHHDTMVLSAPWRIGHVPIVSVAGVSGGVAIDHLAKLPQESP